MKIIMENWNRFLKEARYYGHDLTKSMGIQGDNYKESPDAWTSEIPDEPVSRPDFVHAADEHVSNKLENLDMDWILDDIQDDLEELSKESKSEEDYKLKIKKYLNDNEEELGYRRLGDAVFGGV